MAYNFFALMARMKYIDRWGLMRNTQVENIQEHSHMVAVLSHALAVIGKEKFGSGIDPNEAAVAGLFPAGKTPPGRMLANARQAEAVSRALRFLRGAREALESGLTPDVVLTDAEGALNALGELTGRTLREDLTARIFERFCVGK